MKYICKNDFEINGILIGKQNDVLEIVDAAPGCNETLEDVLGYCDIKNLTTSNTYNATWVDVEENKNAISLER